MLKDYLCAQLFDEFASEICTSLKIQRRKREMHEVGGCSRRVEGGTGGRKKGGWWSRREAERRGSRRADDELGRGSDQERWLACLGGGEDREKKEADDVESPEWFSRRRSSPSETGGCSRRVAALVASFGRGDAFVGEVTLAAGGRRCVCSGTGGWG